MLLMLPDVLLWSFTSKEPVVFLKCPYVFGKCQHLYLKGQHVLMKRPACFMNQLSWSDGQAYHVRQTSQVGSLHYPLTMQVFTFLLSFCHFIITACFTDYRSGFACDGTFVNRRQSFDDLAIGRNNISCLTYKNITFL